MLAETLCKMLVEAIWHDLICVFSTCHISMLPTEDGHIHCDQSGPGSDAEATNAAKEPCFRA